MFKCENKHFIVNDEYIAVVIIKYYMCFNI